MKKLACYLTLAALCSLTGTPALAKEKKATTSPEKSNVMLTATYVDSLSYAIGAAVTVDLQVDKKDPLLMDDFDRGVKDGLTHNESSESMYVVGFSVGSWLKKTKVDPVNIELLKQGLRDALSNDSSAMQISLNQAIEMVEALSAQQWGKETEEMQAERERQEAERFFAENRAKEGVVELPSGLQYKLVSMGRGHTPSAGDVVSVFYRATTIDGTEVESNIGGKPAELPLKAAIKGWAEGIQQHKEGSKFILYIPYHLAYGEECLHNGVVGPYTPLIFEVDFLKIVSPTTTDERMD